MSDLVGVVRTLNEALTWWDASKGFLWQRMENADWGQISRAFDAASVLAGVVEVCPNCEGDGRELDDISAAALARAIGVEAVVNGPCPDCRGGVRIKPDAVEKAAKALVGMFASEGGGGVEWPEWSDLFDSEAEMWRDRARAALWAVLGDEE